MSLALVEHSGHMRAAWLLLAHMTWRLVTVPARGRMDCLLGMIPLACDAGTNCSRSSSTTDV